MGCWNAPVPCRSPSVSRPGTGEDHVPHLDPARHQAPQEAASYGAHRRVSMSRQEHGPIFSTGRRDSLEKRGRAFSERKVCCRRWGGE